MGLQMGCYSPAKGQPNLKLKKILSDIDKLLGDRPVYIKEETPD